MRSKANPNGWYMVAAVARFPSPGGTKIEWRFTCPATVEMMPVVALITRMTEPP